MPVSKHCTSAMKVGELSTHDFLVCADDRSSYDLASDLSVLNH